MRVAARARERLRLEGQHPQVVGDPAPPEDRVEARRELVLLRRDPGGVATRLPVVVEPGRAADPTVLLVVLGAVVAHRDQRGGSDRDRVGAEREGLRDVGAGADAARDDQLDLPVDAELLQSVRGDARGGEGRDADVLDEDILRRRRPSLHPVEDDHVCTRLHAELDVVVGPRRADLHEDRLLPVGELAKLVDLDLQVVGPGPVRMPAGAPLVDPHGQVAHLGDALRDLVAEQHPAAARLGALADDHLNGVRRPQVVRVHPVA